MIYLTFRSGCRKIIESLSLDRLRHIVANAVFRGEPGVVPNLFIRGLGTKTTTDSVRSLFSAYGEFEEAAVIVDRATGKSKVYGFITFRHVDGALRALKEPSKKTDERMTVTQLAAAGNAGTGATPSADVSLLKIYVVNVPADSRRIAFSPISPLMERSRRAARTGKFRGFPLFAYNTAEGARNSLVDPNKNVDGHHLVCNVSIEGKKGKPGTSAPGAVPMGSV
ncbi:hypothetical protein C4D60_Mb01t33080 [Musa balbisiana]|uniref:RRM domain-containing protein n=1 Tax=Musa balbisiana TaxID=52838 RepID=A0A4S8JSI4_MUSBA|nr:hypothetical protein C4D60_Mb01t33080 [Musa balbisiana]